MAELKKIFPAFNPYNKNFTGGEWSVKNVRLPVNIEGVLKVTQTELASK